MDELITRGRCCACDRYRLLRTVVLMQKKAPTAGTGWACIVCGLPPDGAIALICDSCAIRLAALEDATAEIRFVCSSKAFQPGRTPVEMLIGEHKHDLARHIEFNTGACRICGCTDDEACLDEDGPCFWIEPDLCSKCAKTALVAGGSL